MRTTRNINYLALVLTIVFYACTKSQFNDFEPIDSGTADFSNFVAVGNSLTQGFQDNGLHNEFQQQANSFPAIIARQMGVSFKQPLVNGSGSGYDALKDLSPSLIDIAPSSSWTSSGSLNWDKNIRYNNLGVAGIRLTDCVPTEGEPSSVGINQIITSINPFGGYLDFGTIFSPISYLEHIKKSSATFFTCWLGNNDVLAWSINGGDDGEISISGFPTVKISELTPVSVFKSKYDSILSAFQVLGAKGVCATLPDVTSIPFFTTLTLESIGRDIYITEGADTTVIRKATNEDLLLLTTKNSLDSIVTLHGFSPSNPLAHQEVLDRDEVEKVQNHVALLNEEIKTLALAHGIPVVDMNSFLFELKSSLVLDGVNFSARYINGGAFSLDGIHPNTRGYAIIANKFIEVINNNYYSNIRPVVVQDFRGIIFP